MNNSIKEEILMLEELIDEYNHSNDDELQNIINYKFLEF